MKHLHRERPRFVSFSGMDGAGKSTQIEYLRRELTERGLRVSLVTFWDDVARLTHLREVSGHKIFGGDKGVGSPEAPKNRRDKNVRSLPMSLVRGFLYFVDAVSLRSVVHRSLRLNVDVIIFDRYAYDELVNLNLRNPFARLYARLILAFVPRPDVSYILDADPVAARARKPEYPVDFLHLCRASYAALANLAGSMTVISPMPVADVRREVLQHMERQLPASVSSVTR